MAATPKYKIYNGSEYVAACKYAEDAAALVAILGDGSTIRIGHGSRDIVWRQGTDGDAGKSYDAVRDHIHDIEDARFRAGQAKMFA